MTKREVLIQALASTPQDVELTVKGMKDSAVFQRPSPDAWSVADVVYHLGEVEGRYLKRLEMVVREERPYLPYIHPEERRTAEGNLADLMAVFRQERAKTLAFLQGLRPGDWQRKGVHETWGEVSFRYLVQQLVEHDINHLNQIVEIQQNIRTRMNAD